jgi:hypothetical protein
LSAEAFPGEVTVESPLATFRGQGEVEIVFDAGGKAVLACAAGRDSHLEALSNLELLGVRDAEVVFVFKRRRKGVLRPRLVPENMVTLRCSDREQAHRVGAIVSFAPPLREWSEWSTSEARRKAWGFDRLWVGEGHTPST